jgi:hypothetical protein
VSAGLEAADEHAAFGTQFGVAVHDAEQGTAIAVRGDLHVGISSIRRILAMRRFEWAASLFAGFDRTSGEDYKDITFPVGIGLTFAVPIGEVGALSLQPRYNYHLGDESPMEGPHELMLSVGFHWVPSIAYMTKD